MNVYDLDTLTLQQCRLEETDRAEYSARFLVAYNFAYGRIMREKWKPWTTEAVVLDANRCFLISALTNTCVTIQNVSDYADFSSGANYGKGTRYTFYEKDGAGTIVVPEVDGGETVYVTYQYTPSRLEAMTSYDAETFAADATNTPQFDEDYHDILTYWATHRYYTARGANYISVSAYWKQMFDDAFGKIKRDYGGKQELQNFYHPL